MNISPGNLYYHFRNKDDIIGELYAAYEATVVPLLTVPEETATRRRGLVVPAARAVREDCATTGSCNRDLDEITVAATASSALRFADLTRRGERTVIELCRSLVRTGQMQASEREIGALAANATLISTYWMSWQRIVGMQRGGRRGIPARVSLDHAAYHVLALVAPFLVGDGRALIERLGEDYL